MRSVSGSALASASGRALATFVLALACLSGCEVHVGLGGGVSSPARPPVVAEAARGDSVALARARAVIASERARVDEALGRATKEALLAPESTPVLERRLRLVGARRDLAALSEWLESHPDEVPGWLADGGLVLIEVDPGEPTPAPEAEAEVGAAEPTRHRPKPKTMTLEPEPVERSDEDGRDPAKDKVSESKREASKPTAPAPTEGLIFDNRAAAFVVASSLSSEQAAEVERQLRRAVACVPHELARGPVKVRGVVASGRLVRPEVRGEPPLPPALESCVIEAVRRVRLPLSERVRGQPIEVALPPR